MKKQNVFLENSRGKMILAVSALGIFFGASANAQWNLGSLSIFALPNSSILGILTSFLTWLLLILGIVAIISFIISGLLYLTAAGDENQIGRAKRAMTYSIIGIIVGLSGLIAIRAIYTALQAVPLF
jgi:hypothetical protein